MVVIMALAAVGFCISLYTYLLEKKVKAAPDYKGFCDLSDTISCTKPMKTQYANLFYYSNAFIGMVFYLVVILLAYFKATSLLILATTAACAFSALLAYFLYFKIKSFCLLCTSLYIINILLLLLSLRAS
jgi:vitamin-K-epoxide reductase (warfarin-sensitive)